MIIDDEFYIEHFGTKGMRWGRRKAQPRFTKEQKKKAAKAGLATAATYAAFAGVTAAGLTFLNSPKGRELTSQATRALLAKKGARDTGDVGRIFVKDFINAKSKLVSEQPARLLMLNRG